MIKQVGKKIFLFAVLLPFLQGAKASGDTLYYVGNIIVSKKVSFAYNLRFTINSKNEVTGYSLTDAGGTSETKVRISGLYDSLKETINFEEKNIVRTKVDQSQNDLCFVHATLTFKHNKLIETLAGKFSGFKLNGNTPCANGEIKLINARKGQNIRSTVDKMLTPLQKKEDASKPLATETKKEIMKVSDDKGIVLPFTGNTVQLTIWDNGMIDGDRVSVMLNDVYLVKDYTLDSTKKIINAPLTNNAVDTVKIIALNEGKIAPNTAMIRVESTTETYPIEVRAAVNEVRKIYLKKKDTFLKKQ